MSTKSPKSKKSTPKKKSITESPKKSIPPRDGSFAVEELIRQGNARPQPLHVYMNLEQMKQSGFKVSDFVYLDTESTSSFGIIWPSVGTPFDTVQMTFHLLKNLDDPKTVKVRHCATAAILADQIKLIPIDTKVEESMEMYLKEVMIDLEFTIDGHLIECPVDGKSTWFRVELPKSTKPDFIYQINRSTSIKILVQKTPRLLGTSFDSIGGLQTEITQIKEMIEKPLHNPEIFLQYGLKPPRGLLLYGPPGTGKTLIARAVASETEAHVIIVNGPEIISKYYGDTEARLAQIFEEARQYQPTIIFFDELDSICPNRDDSASDLEKRIVGCLLSLMDGGKENERIVVIGATNRPDALDPALRRPGRFDREFEIGIPSKEARLDILTKLLSKFNHSLLEKDIDEISGKCHGYVGADLAAVCREGGLIALQRYRKEMGLGVKDEELSQKELIVTLQDLVMGMSLVKPSVMREVLVQVPKVLWDDIGGQEDVKQRLKEAVEWPLKNPELFRKFNIRPPKGLLLYGPPGCSKTLMAKALATESGLNFLAVKGPEVCYFDVVVQ
jgi:SpoVK/Ycf46/Vps4 family AAA+-type ATPase